MYFQYKNQCNRGQKYWNRLSNNVDLTIKMKLGLNNVSYKRDRSKINCSKEYKKGTVNKDFGNETGQGNENRFSKVTLT